VRELQNVIEHAVVTVEPGAELTPADLSFVEILEPNAEALDWPEGAEDAGYYQARDQLLAAFDRRFLQRVVSRAGGNLSKAARLAGIDRTSFYRLMERHGLDRDLLSGGEAE
jgi:DNA-binding NtrC family response regulator